MGINDNTYLSKNPLNNGMKSKHALRNEKIAPTPGKVILLGEDDIDDQEILEEIFSSIDPSLRLQFINNGKKLVSHLEKVKNERLPCLIVLDYNMPELNGAEILKNLHNNLRVKSIPKII